MADTNQDTHDESFSADAASATPDRSGGGGDGGSTGLDAIREKIREAATQTRSDDLDRSRLYYTMRWSDLAGFLSPLQERIVTLESTVETQRTEVESLRGKLEEAQRELREGVGAERDRLEREVESLRRSLEEAQALADDLQKQLEKLRAERDQEIQTLQERLRKAEGALSISADEKARRISELEKELRTLRERYEPEIKRLRELVHQLQLQLKYAEVIEEPDYEALVAGLERHLKPAAEGAWSPRAGAEAAPAVEEHLRELRRRIDEDQHTYERAVQLVTKKQGSIAAVSDLAKVSARAERVRLLLGLLDDIAAKAS